MESKKIGPGFAQPSFRQLSSCYSVEKEGLKDYS